MSRLAVIGPGRVGTLLATAAVRAGYRVTAVAGGHEASRNAFCRVVAGARPVATASEAARIADLLVLAVPDDALPGVVTSMARDDAIDEHHRIVHVAGSLGVGVLRRAALAGAGVAACHPAMTVPEGATDPEELYGVAWAVTVREPDRAWAEEFVTRLGGDPRPVAEDRRVLYHAALALASNAVGAAVATARQLLLAAAVAQPEDFVEPLARASVANTARLGASALTGPVARGDVGTLTRHLAAIEADVGVLDEPYRLLTRATLASLRAVLDPDVVARLDAVLAEPPGDGAGP